MKKLKVPEDKRDGKGDAQKKRKGQSEKRALAVPFLWLFGVRAMGSFLMAIQLKGKKHVRVRGRWGEMVLATSRKPKATSTF